MALDIEIPECPDRAPLSENVQLDDEADIATIYGVKISGVLLRTLGKPTPHWIWFRVVKVEDGVSTIERATRGSSA